MVSRSDDAINFDKLEAELNDAVDADERYQRENDAKFRAVNQRVATYEEFRDIVLASHIKPLEKSDLLKQETFKQQWNVQASTYKHPTDQPADEQTFSSKTQVVEVLPKNALEFSREWRRNCKTTTDRYSYLKTIGADNLGKIFKAEVGFGLLGDFLCCLNEGLQPDDHSLVLRILLQLSETGRFDLNVQFLSANEQKASRDLVDKISDSLQRNCPSDDITQDIEDVKTRYHVRNK